MITVLTGDNSWARQRELAQQVAAFVKANGELGLERLDGSEADFARMSEALTSLPFLAPKKMVVLKNPGASKEFVEQYENLLKNIPETTDLILVEAKLDKRSSLYKFFKKSTDYKEYNQLDSARLASWLVQEAKENGGELSVVSAAFLVERTGENQQKLASELEKLLTYNPKISKENIALLVETTPHSKIFDLLDAAFAGNTKHALELYDEQKALGVAPQEIIAMLAWQLKILAIIKAGKDRPADQLAAEAKLNPYVVRKSSGIARRLTFEQIKHYVSELLALDISLKRTTINADAALSQYLLTLKQ